MPNVVAQWCGESTRALLGARAGVRVVENLDVMESVQWFLVCDREIGVIAKLVVRGGVGWRLSGREATRSWND
jgi:hypothetical protein